MIQFCARDIFIRKKIYILLLVVLVLISSTTNTILIYFFQEINMDRSTNKYYNIYMMDTSEISNEQTIKLLQELTKSKRFHVTGSFFVGNLLVNSNTYKCVAFTYSDVKKFYQTKSNLTATDGRMIVDGSLSPNLLNYLEYKEVDVSNLIYACDLSEHIDFVFSKNDYAKRGIQTQRLGVEFDKHLTIPEVRALKKLRANISKQIK